MTYAIHKIEGLPKVEESRKVTFENIRYGMMVEVLDYNSSGYHSGCKVHFFNKKGVLVGNYYEFMPYERLRLRKEGVIYPRFFMSFKRFRRKTPLGERVKMWLFVRLLNLITVLIKYTQRIVD
jgi:hypothetical protein